MGLSEALVLLVATLFAAPVHGTQTEARANQTEVVIARVSLATQTMNVYVGNTLMYEWSVSTARRGYRTPTGSYAPYWLDKNHRSQRYNNAPMPYSIFFQGHYAIHGTTESKYLGQRVSHGCIRLLTENARTLYTLVQQYGKENTKIIIES